MHGLPLNFIWRIDVEKNIQNKLGRSMTELIIFKKCRVTHFLINGGTRLTILHVVLWKKISWHRVWCLSYIVYTLHPIRVSYKKFTSELLFAIWKPSCCFFLKYSRNFYNFSIDVFCVFSPLKIFSWFKYFSPNISMVQPKKIKLWKNYPLVIISWKL